MYLETTVYRTGLPRPHAQRAGVYAQNHENDVERWTLCLLQGRIGRPMALFFAFSRPLAEGWPGSAGRWPKLQLSTLHTVAFDHEPCHEPLVTKSSRHGASGESQKVSSFGCADGEARRSPVPPLDQLRAPPARDTLFAPQRARLPSCRLDIVAATLCAARRKCSKTAER